MFHRFWSVRNLDVLMLLLLTPGLMLIHESYRAAANAGDLDAAVVSAESVKNKSAGSPTEAETSSGDVQVTTPEL